MCGISGVIDLSGKEVDKGSLESMNARIRHRGPDGDGFYYYKNLGLGHRRLAILDLTESGKQPMAFADKYVLIFNGEIYNYIEIREELKTLGYNFHSDSDTEVILASYDKWGADCVNRFNGMWAFALHDRTRNILFCSRDRFGVKPFYYLTTGTQFAFSSEIKQLIPILDVVKARKENLINYLVLGLEDYDEHTFFEHVLKLKAGHNLFFDLDNNSFRVEKWYTLQKDKSYESFSEEEACHLFRKEFERSIRYRLRSDVKVGTCLSGGLDSSSIAVIAGQLYKKESGKRFSAITAQSIDPANDESAYARKVVEKADLDWHVVSPGTADFKRSLDTVISVQEEPFGGPSIVMQYFVLQMSASTGNTVLLDGQGGDETLLGYERYLPAFILSQNFSGRIREFRKAVKNTKLSALQLLGFLYYFTKSSIRLSRQKRRWSFMNDSMFSFLNSELIEKMSDSYRDISKLQILELTESQLPHLLKYEDKNSMAHSIETRLPFLDYKLVELAISLPASMKIKDGWTKYILRKSLSDVLPSEVAWRKNKFGFEAPESEWFRDKNLFMEEIRSSRILKKILTRIPSEMEIDNNILWKLYNVARWEKLFNVTLE